MIHHNPIHFISENQTGRDFVVGDIHGCYEDFMALLQSVKFHKARDRVFSVGDLINRGPHSLKSLELLKQPWFFSCRGNHEQMLIDWLRAPYASEPYDPSWMSDFFGSFTKRQQFAGAWLSILERMPYVISVGKDEQQFLVVHAEILESKKSVTQEMIEQWAFSDPEKAQHRAIWGRSLITAYENNKQVARAHDVSVAPIYCGHTIVSDPIMLARQHYIDGGAFMAYHKQFNGERCCMRLVEPKTQTCWEIDTRRKDIHLCDILTPQTL